MKLSISTTVITLLFLLSTARAAIPTIFERTAPAFRNSVLDKDFILDSTKAIIVTRPDYTAEILNYQSFPVMASIDIQSTLIRATIKAQKPFIVHYHPRGSETLTVLEGTIRIGMKFEGLMGREIENEVKKGQATVIPQGILHSFFCSSTVDCVFMSVLNSADPGTIVV